MAGKSAQNNFGLAGPRPGCRLVGWHKAMAPVPTVITGLTTLEILGLGFFPAESPRPRAKTGRTRPIQMQEVPIQNGDDVIRARQSAREMARELGFVIVDQIAIATAASELSRNAYQYSGTGKVIIKPLSRNHSRGIEIVIEDQGPGIPDLEQALQDDLTPSSAQGHGLRGSKRLVDEFEIESQTGAGTRITIRKWMK
jgi:serine/threonine-protein kinase RsbT